ncbi:MAG: hypothetical protein GXX96_18800 [Planctomycetaceae bacterium]|nr:hypothetical protein [Planctomycetaceae bacterium]
MSEITRILTAIDQGDHIAAEQLLPLVYDELRKLAAAKMAQEPADHTFQPTALVHEAYLRLVESEQAQHWNNARIQRHWVARWMEKPNRARMSSSR